MEVKQRNLTAEYLKGCLPELGAILLLLGECVVIGTVVYLLFLGVGSDKMAFLDLIYKIIIPIVVGMIVISNLRGAIYFAKYGFAFNPSYEIYSKITRLIHSIAIFLPFGLSILTYLISKDIGVFLLTIVVTLAISAIFTGWFNYVRTEKYNQHLKDHRNLENPE